MKIRWRFLVWIWVVFFVIYKNPIHCQPKPLILVVSPRFCLEPCNVSIRVHIVRHESNRYLYIAWGRAEQFFEQRFSESLISLDGERSDSVFERKAEGLTEGEYIVYAVLYRKELKDGKEVVSEYSDQTKVVVGEIP